MKPLKFSLIAVACAAVLTACSSHKDSVNSYLDSQANQGQQNANQKAKEAEQAKQAAEQKLREAEQKLAEAEKKLSATAPSASSSELNETKQQLAAAQDELTKAQKNVEALQQELGMLKQANAEQAETTRLEKIRSTIQASITANAPNTENKASLSGTQLIIEGKNLTVTAPQAEANYNHLQIDGKKIELLSEAQLKEYGGIYDQDKRDEHNKTAFNTLTNEKGETVGKVSRPWAGRSASEFTEVRYGVLTENGKSRLFVQGHLTPATEPDQAVNSPITNARLRDLTGLGQSAWVYQGNALYGINNEYTEFAAKGIADMAQKKVKIDVLNADNSVKFSLGGHITDNTFAGEYNGTVTSGAFYGTKGQDMAGTFYQTSGEEKDYHGVFGVTRSKDGTGWSAQHIKAEDNALADFDVKK